MSIVVSVVVLNWNGQKLLEQFLPSVVENNPSYAEVVVADNGSTDSSIAYLRQHFPQVRIITLDQNYGFAGGYNRAIAQVDSEYVVLLNSDVEVTAGWLDPMLTHCQQNPTVAGCQPKILGYKRRDHFEYAGASGGFIDRYGYPYCRGRIFDTVECDRGQYDTTIPIFWATGAALFLRTACYRAVEGLDEDFFAHMEEIDLCWRIQLKGWQLHVTPQSCVYHLGGATLSANNPQKTYLNFRNNLLMLHKNLPLKVGRRLLFIRRVLDTLAFVKFLLTGAGKQAYAVIRAHRDFIKMRKNYHPSAEINIMDNFKESQRNITVDYFLKGAKKYQ